MTYLYIYVHVNFTGNGTEEPVEGFCLLLNI